MSCFGGRVKELKNVSVDCFENRNIYSTTYFLSHCHTGLLCEYIVGKNKLTFKFFVSFMFLRSELWFL
jgi:hypothetical protein